MSNYKVRQFGDRDYLIEVEQDPGLPGVFCIELDPALTFPAGSRIALGIRGMRQSHSAPFSIASDTTVKAVSGSISADGVVPYSAPNGLQFWSNLEAPAVSGEEVRQAERLLTGQL